MTTHQALSGSWRLRRLAAKNKQRMEAIRSVHYFRRRRTRTAWVHRILSIIRRFRLKNIVGMINMDMIGRLNNDRLFVGGVGTSPISNPGWKISIKSVHLQLDYSDSGYGASDHMSFNAKKIPVLFFFSGLHTDYHKPSDTYDKINANGAVKVLSLVYHDDWTRSPTMRNGWSTRKSSNLSRPLRGVAAAMVRTSARFRTFATI